MGNICFVAGKSAEFGKNSEKDILFGFFMLMKIILMLMEFETMLMKNPKTLPKWKTKSLSVKCGKRKGKKTAENRVPQILVFPPLWAI